MVLGFLNRYFNFSSSTDVASTFFANTSDHYEQRDMAIARQRWIMMNTAITDIAEMERTTRLWSKKKFIAYTDLLKKLEYSEETYGLFDGITDNVIKKIRENVRNGAYDNIDYSNITHAQLFFKNISDMFFSELEEVCHKFIRPNIFSEDTKDDALAWTFRASPDEFLFGKNIDVYLARHAIGKTPLNLNNINSVVHELTHQAMNQLAILIHNKSIVPGIDISPLVACDALIRMRMNEQQICQFDHETKTGYQLYRLDPDEILAHRQGNYIEFIMGLMNIANPSLYPEKTIEDFLSTATIFMQQSLDAAAKGDNTAQSQIEEFVNYLSAAQNPFSALRQMTKRNSELLLTVEANQQPQ